MYNSFVELIFELISMVHEPLSPPTRSFYWPQKFFFWQNTELAVTTAYAQRQLISWSLSNVVLMVECNGQSIPPLLSGFIFCSPHLLVNKHLKVLVNLASAIKSINESHVVHLKIFDVLPHRQEPRALKPSIFLSIIVGHLALSASQPLVIKIIVQELPAYLLVKRSVKSWFVSHYFGNVLSYSLHLDIWHNESPASATDSSGLSLHEPYDQPLDGSLLFLVSHVEFGVIY